MRQIIDNPAAKYLAEPVSKSPESHSFTPSSPLSLAISATLALIPHPEDSDPSSASSKSLRRQQAQYFAYAAIESVESELEILNSATDPSEALCNGNSVCSRETFHPQASFQNECIIALLLLSSYEYAQRGNIAKMRGRASQALDMALALKLHSRGHEEGPFAEGNRRAWWMTVSTIRTTLAIMLIC